MNVCWRDHGTIRERRKALTLIHAQTGLNICTHITVMLPLISYNFTEWLRSSGASSGEPPPPHTPTTYLLLYRDWSKYLLSCNEVFFSIISVMFFGIEGSRKTSVFSPLPTNPDLVMCWVRMQT